MYRIVKLFLIELYIGITSLFGIIGTLFLGYVLSIGYHYDSLGYKLNWDFMFTSWFLICMYIFSFSIQNFMVYSAPKMTEAQ